MNKYIVHIQGEDGYFYSFEAVAESIYELMKEFPNAYLIDEL